MRSSPVALRRAISCSTLGSASDASHFADNRLSVRAPEVWQFNDSCPVGSSRLDRQLQGALPNPETILDGSWGRCTGRKNVEPGPRTGALSWSDNGGADLFLFGGIGCSEVALPATTGVGTRDDGCTMPLGLSDLWHYNTDSGDWRLLVPQTASAAGLWPRSRQGRASWTTTATNGKAHINSS